MTVVRGCCRERLMGEMVRVEGQETSRWRPEQ